MRSAAAFALVPAVASHCCYQGCNDANQGCNHAGEYCDSEEACAGCGGVWCGGSGPAPSPSPSPSPAPSGAFCPSASDLIVHYGDAVELKPGGWTIQGNGGAATRTSFDLLGGYVEFDVDVSNVALAVNANLYAIAPSTGSEGFQPEMYCDGAVHDQPGDNIPYCIELDFVESNGNCGAAATVHTIPGPGNDGCTAWGCRTHFMYDGQAKYHMRVEYNQDGAQRVIKDGRELSGWSPAPDGQTWSEVQKNMQSKGVVIIGTEWTGWVPLNEECNSGDANRENQDGLAQSTYKIENLVISGRPVQGPSPQRCSSLNSTMTV